MTQFNPNIDMTSRKTIRISIQKISSFSSDETWHDLLRSCYFIRTLFAMFFMFTAVAGVYCGLGKLAYSNSYQVSAYNAAALPGSIFVNNTLNGVADILSYIVCAFIMEKIDRVKIMTSTFGFAAVIAALCGILFFYGTSRTRFKLI